MQPEEEAKLATFPLEARRVAGGHGFVELFDHEQVAVFVERVFGAVVLQSNETVGRIGRSHPLQGAGESLLRQLFDPVNQRGARFAGGFCAGKRCGGLSPGHSSLKGGQPHPLFGNGQGVEGEGLLADLHSQQRFIVRPGAWRKEMPESHVQRAVGGPTGLFYLAVIT